MPPCKPAQDAPGAPSGPGRERAAGGMALLGLALAGVLGATPGPEAAAGAWTKAPGRGQLIATTGRRAAPITAFVGEPAQSDSNFSQLYVEYGVIEGLTLGGVAFVEVSTSDFEDNAAEVGVFARKRLWHSDWGGVASVQLGYSHPLERMIGEGFAGSEPDSVPEIQARALYGQSFWGGWGNAFVSLEAGYHWQRGDRADEIRADVTGGYAPWRCCMGLLSLYSLTPIGEGTEASLTIAPSFAYTIVPRIGPNEKKPFHRLEPTTVQIGVSYDLLNLDDGLGVQVSIWQAF